MAVTIGEMEVETKEPSAPSAATPAETKAETHVNLRVALEMLEERKLRLQAD